MRAKSHHALGQYLLDRYLKQIPGFHARAFLFGCVQPDRNPLTYLKGSMRYQWFRGHNYPHTRRFIRRLSRRLENRQYWSVLDYYAMGKLIHYTADAFTYAHNADFDQSLSFHRKYEDALQKQFFDHLSRNPTVDLPIAGSVMETIGSLHRKYRSEPVTIHRDCIYTLQICCCVLSQLTSRKISQR